MAIEHPECAEINHHLLIETLDRSHVPVDTEAVSEARMSGERVKMTSFRPACSGGTADGHRRQR